MTADTCIPLASSADMAQGAFADLVRSYAAPALDAIMVQATRACETETTRRLAPFTLTESHRAEGVDPDELTDSSNLPMDLQGAMGRSYAAALSTSTLIRHVWLNEYAPVFQDMWTYTLAPSPIQIVRSYGGGQTVTVGQVDGPEPDTGHVWFHLGLFVPIGSLIRVTYSGGYTTVPADLKRACIYQAAAIVARELDPMNASHGHDAGTLEALASGWLAPFARS